MDRPVYLEKLPGGQPVCDAVADERRDLLLPRLKRLRRPGCESRGRAEGARIRRNDHSGTVRAVRRPRRGPLVFSKHEVHRFPEPGEVLALLQALIGARRLRRRAPVALRLRQARRRGVLRVHAHRRRPLAPALVHADRRSTSSKTLPLYEAALRKLEALKPPSSDDAAVRAWLAADRRVAKARAAISASAAQRRDFPGVTAAAARAQLAGSESRQRRGRPRHARLRDARRLRPFEVAARASRGRPRRPRGSRPSASPPPAAAPRARAAPRASPSSAWSNRRFVMPIPRVGSAA